MYYLNREDERLGIAHAGRELALEHAQAGPVLGKWPTSYLDPVILFSLKVLAT